MPSINGEQFLNIALSFYAHVAAESASNRQSTAYKMGKHKQLSRNFSLYGIKKFDEIEICIETW